MRALWLIPAVLALFSAAANAGSEAVTARESASAHFVRVAAPSGPGNSSRGGNMHGPPGIAHRHPVHRPGYGYGYGLPYVAPYDAQSADADPGQADSGYADSRQDGSDDGEAYAQAPFEQPQDDGYAASAVPTIQAAISYAVHYFTSGQQPPAHLPPNARVTKGTLYKYTQNGVDTYTDIPPPSDIGAKKLFSYTEVDVPPAR
jgi:hypothetical protein